MTLRKLIALAVLAFGLLAVSPASADSLCMHLDLPAERTTTVTISGETICIPLP